jgi:acetolactate synthase regulatory subunit
MPDVKVKTIKGFNNGGQYAKRNTEITVDELRARDLLRNGLIEEYDVKKAEEPKRTRSAGASQQRRKGTATKPKE